jgi:hypothetical protein
MQRYGFVAVLVFVLCAVVYVQRHPPQPFVLPLSDLDGRVPMVSDEHPLCHMDSVSVGGAVENVIDVPAPHVSVKEGKPVTVVGWAVDARQSQLAAGVAATVDGKLKIAGTYGAARPDVAQAFHSPGFTQSGLRIVVPASGLATGRHELQLLILSADRSTFYRMATPLTIEVAS